MYTWLCLIRLKLCNVQSITICVCIVKCEIFVIRKEKKERAEVILFLTYSNIENEFCKLVKTLEAQRNLLDVITKKNFLLFKKKKKKT